MRSIFRSKIVRFVALPLIVVVLLAIAGGGWYFSDVLEADGLRVDHDPEKYLIAVAEIGTDTITLRHPPDEESESLGFSAIWGVTDDENYGRVGDIISTVDDLVTRQYTPVVGDFQVGDFVRMDRSSYPFDPLTAHGLEYEEVALAAPLGNIAAWHVEADSDTWAILVHGRTSNRETSLRLLDDLDRLNVHSLTIEYRNDLNSPPSESGYYDFGTTEWEDVETAAQYAVDNGAKDIILVGYSMGGGIVASYQLKSELADRTVGMILDAPMLNFGRTVDKGAEERSVPGVITFAAKVISGIRFGVDWDALDFLSHADEIDVPVLLFHGDTDDTVPIETSIEFAAASPELFELHTYEGVGHVAAWNWFQQDYESAVKDFIERIR